MVDMEVFSLDLIRYVFPLAMTVMDEGGDYHRSSELINLEEKTVDLPEAKNCRSEVEIIDLGPFGACGSDGGGSSVVGGDDGTPMVRGSNNRGWWLVATGDNVYVFFKFEMREKIEFMWCINLI
ncbi:unnamed protein product [Lactuca saligna]|uniref:Uncharacterized protein n=1 Tax=Lactuca saligna TaxID=75948 RepID=A0AA35VLR6_LACSI|nr:unnamed protein product [Lactuca saligna]